MQVGRPQNVIGKRNAAIAKATKMAADFGVSIAVIRVGGESFSVRLESGDVEKFSRIIIDPHGAITQKSPHTTIDFVDLEGSNERLE